jgi:hypothetical protein
MATFILIDEQLVNLDLVRRVTYDKRLSITTRTMALKSFAGDHRGAILAVTGGAPQICRR